MKTTVGVEAWQEIDVSPPPSPSLRAVPLLQAKLRQKRRKEARLELERVRALEEKAEVLFVVLGKTGSSISD